MAESEMNPTRGVGWARVGSCSSCHPRSRTSSPASATFGSIDDPEWNIAAGIMHDRGLWRRWERDSIDVDRREFMFASYNAGEGTIMNAQRACVPKALDRHARGRSVEAVAPEVPRWRYRETLGYVRKIRGGIDNLDDKGRVKKAAAAKKP